MEASTLTTFLTSVGTVLTSVVGWMGTIVSAIMSTPVLLVPCILGLSFTAVALFKSLKS